MESALVLSISNFILVTLNIQKKSNYVAVFWFSAISAFDFEKAIDSM